MATVRELKATARPKSGKGAARAERRAGKVPGVIYGNNLPPVTISVEDRELRQRILAGRFLTTIYDIDLEGKKHRVIRATSTSTRSRISRSMSTSCGSAKARPSASSVPLAYPERGTSPGVKRGGTVNIVHPYPRARMLGRQHSAVHRGRCRCAGNQPLAASVRRQAAGCCEVTVARGCDAGHHRAAVGLRRRAEGRRWRRRCSGCGRCTGGCRRSGCCSRCGCQGSGRGCQGSRRWWRQEEVISRGMPRHAALCRTRQSRREIRA